MSQNPNIYWRTTTNTCNNSGFTYRAENTSATADGTTCVLGHNHRWATAAAAGGVLGGVGVAIGAALTSAGQTIAWAQSPPRPHRRRDDLHRERIGGWGTHDLIERHCGCSVKVRRSHHRGRPESIRTAHEITNRAYEAYERGRKAGLKAKIEQQKAIDQSLKLLKGWLSDMEYSYLMEQGELELPSQYEKDVIYIVKRDHTARVRIQKRPHISCIHQMPIVRDGEACINIDGNYPIGDSLLAKIALIKGDEKAFLDIANISWYKHEREREPRQYDGRFDYIRRERNSGFWFVQLDDRGRCGTAYETTTDLNFLHIHHQRIPVGDNVHNNIAVPGARQYFIWASQMITAVNTARRLFRENQRAIEEHERQAAQDVEREYHEHGTIINTMTWNEQEHNDVLVRYANSTDNGQVTYTVTRLGDEAYEETH